MSRPGRPEKPIEAATGPLGCLAAELRRLRDNRPYHQIAAETGLSAAILRRAAAGSQLPTWRVTVAFTVACRGEPDAVRELWEMACVSLGQPVPVARSPAPDPAAVPPVPDPGTIASAADFVLLMRRLWQWADQPSLAELNRRSGGFSLPPSTVSDVLRGAELPRLELVVPYLRACRLAEDQCAQWEQAWLGLRVREITQHALPARSLGAELLSGHGDGHPVTPLPTRLRAHWWHG